MAAERENQIQSLSIAEPDCRGDHFADIGKMIL